MSKAQTLEQRQELMKNLVTKEQVLEAVSAGKLTTQEALARINNLSRQEGRQNSIINQLRNYFYDTEDLSLFEFLSTLIFMIGNEALDLSVESKQEWLLNHKEEIVKDNQTMFSCLNVILIALNKTEFKEQLKKEILGKDYKPKSTDDKF